MHLLVPTDGDLGGWPRGWRVMGVRGQHLRKPHRLEAVYQADPAGGMPGQRALKLRDKEISRPAG